MQPVTEQLVGPEEESDGVLKRDHRAPRSGSLVNNLHRLRGDLLAAAAGVAAAALLLDPVDATFVGLWWFATVVVIRSDLDRFIIPDGASATIAGLGLLHGGAVSILAGEGWHETAQLSAARVAGAGVAFATFWLVARVFRLSTGREGLGFGDVKLAGACAVWLSFDDQIIALEIAALAGLAVLLVLRRHRDAPPAAIPFGAFLAPAAWLEFVAGPTLHQLIDLHA